MLEAEHYSQQIAGSDGSSWEVIKNNGQRGDTMKAMPNTAAYTEDYANTAKLIYHVYFKKAGTVNGTLYRLPTLNEGKEDNGNARSCRVGIGTGNGTPVILRGNSGWQEMYSYNNPNNTWAQNIMRMYEPLNFTLNVSEGWNDIVLYRMNAAMVVDRILLRTENGAVKDSLQGPDESPNNIAQRAEVSVAEIPEEVADAVFHADMKINIADGKTAYPEDIKVTSASSTEKRVAEVEVKDGKLSVIPKMPGKAEISVTTEKESFTFQVTVEPDKNTEGVYQESEGQVVMQASDALAQSGEAFTAAGTGNHTWGLDGIGMKVQPDNGTTWTDGSMSGLNGKAPAATYKVQISTAGTYRLYVNTSNPDVNADSYHLAVDGNFVYTDKNDDGGGTATGKETWYGGNQTLNLTAGIHTITIFAREDGFTLNQLCLTTGNRPSGLFEKSSERVTAEIPEEVLFKAEAENLKYTTNSLTTRVSSGDTNASGSAFLAIDSSKVGDYIEFEVDVPDYITSAKIVTGYKTKNNRGNLQLSVNGTDYGQPIVMAANEEKYVTTEAGEEIELKAGEKNTFRYTVTKGGVLCLDYIGLYYKADISMVGLLTDAVLGEMPQNPSEASGTDEHTAVVHSLDKDTRTITSYVRKEADLSALPVTFSLRRSKAKILLDGEAFNNGDKVDFSQGDRIFEFQYGDYTEKWIVKQPAIAYNAVLPGQYSDPDIDILDGKFWIFPTTDGTADWGGTKFHAFSSENLVNWKDEGVIVDLAAEESYKNENNVDVAVIPWASGHAWAPSIEEKDGKYYFYFCGQWEGSKETVMGRRQAIGVAVADDPAGPYKVMDHPLITREEWFRAINRTSGGQCIDPSIFKDDDGTYYLMFGNGIPSVAQLGEDMQSIVPGTIKTLSGMTNFTESVVVNKINGKYHFTWTCNDTGSPDYCVRYGTADSVYGPVNSRGILLQKDESGDMLGTGHQSILRNGNDYYIAYHRFYTPLGVYTEGLGYHRETCIEKLSFDNDGYFNVLSPTMEGPGEAAPYNAELKNSLTQAEEILKEKDQYEEAGIQKLEEVIKKAKEVYADYYATVEMVNRSVKELKDTEAALVPKDLDVAERAEAAAKAAKEAADAANAAAKTAESTKAEAVKAVDEAKAAKAEAEAAKAVAESAKAAAEKAKQDAEAAKAEADSDKAAAEAAAQRAESAENAAKAAQEKAETAQTKAEAASSAAQSAKANVETAENNAKTAQANAETAADAAKDAKEAAELAKTDAIAAQTKAEEAQQKAETAKEAAVSAKEAVEEAKGKAEAAATEAKEAKEAAETAGSAAKAQADLAKAYADAAQASAEKALAAEKEAADAAKRAEEAYKKAEEKLAQAQKEAEEKLAKMEELLKAERFQNQKAKIKKVNAGKGKLQVSWKAVEGADGYVIEYAQKANFKGKKQVVVANRTKTSQKISKLKKKKTYYVRIRAYQENGSEKVYTRFSAKKKARTK